MNQYINYKKWRLARLNRHQSGYSFDSFGPPEGSTYGRKYTKEHIDTSPTHYSPWGTIGHPHEDNIANVIYNLKYAGHTSDGLSFPDINTGGQHEEYKEPHLRPDLGLTYHTHVDVPSPVNASNYAGAIIYKALSNMGKNEESKGDKDHIHFLQDLEESLADAPTEHLEALEPNEKSIFHKGTLTKSGIYSKPIIRKNAEGIEIQMPDGLNPMAEDHARRMAAMTSTLYNDYLGKGIHGETFGKFLNRVPPSNNPIENIYLSKLKSMVNGDHLA